MYGDYVCIYDEGNGGADGTNEYADNRPLQFGPFPSLPHPAAVHGRTFRLFPCLRRLISVTSGTFQLFPCLYCGPRTLSCSVGWHLQLYPCAPTPESPDTNNTEVTASHSHHVVLRRRPSIFCSHALKTWSCPSWHFCAPSTTGVAFYDDFGDNNDDDDDADDDVGDDDINIWWWSFVEVWYATHRIM